MLGLVPGWDCVGLSMAPRELRLCLGLLSGGMRWNGGRVRGGRPSAGHLTVGTSRWD